ncbi:MAG: GTPase Era [Deltaproteobacteria bacterium]|nr:GTPase Era [Deltaproteobacteria bacterium]
MSFKYGHVALVGEPNVGKSTLLNKLVGEQLAIVTPKPQTTRHRIAGIINREDAQIVVLDTPGFHFSSKPLNVAMLEVVDNVLQEADVICLMLDPKAMNAQLNKRLFDRIPKEKVIVVINKADTITHDEFEKMATSIHTDWGVKEIVVISALHDIGVSHLISLIIDRFTEGQALYPRDAYTQHPTRFLAAEIVRAQVFLQMGEEIPYITAVAIDEFREPTAENSVTLIRAAIVVEKESQKAMVIGKHGARIKEIGVKARLQIEDLIGSKVFLELFVRVEKQWTKDRDKIKEFGYV